MLVFWPEKLVFLAVPKTGSTAFQVALESKASIILRDPPEIKHSAVYRYRRFLKPYFQQAGGQEMETMAVVRNPVDWLSSWYRYRNRDGLIGHPNSTRGISFDVFVNEYLKGKRETFANLGSQARFLTTADGSIGVDHLFQYEQQDKMIGFLEDRLSLKIDLEKKNVSPKMDLNLSPKIEEKLYRKAALDFSVWEAGKR